MEKYYWIIVVAVAAIAAVWLRKLTVGGGGVGWMIGCIMIMGVGYKGIVLMGCFFVLGTLATSWGVKKKQQLGLAEREKGRRAAGQVWANGGVAFMIVLLALVNGSSDQLYVLAIAGAFSSATADTLSSELGNVYGRRFYNIISWKKDQRGLDGVISLEGTVAGLIGSFVIGVVYCLLTGWDRSLVVIAVAGLVGNLFDSVLGATVERKGWLSNDAVNFLNTATGAAVVLVLS